ncbi:MAG: hypothetical protein WCV93_00360 [Candidatus Shapirobacteria bacterium]|jgi:predicted phage terminase large subunit-like protein
MKQVLNEAEKLQIAKNRSVRKTLARNSHFWFFTIYFNHYISHPFAPFHNEMFSVTEDIRLKLAVFVAFRGSSKSTLMSLSYPIWAIIGCQQRKFVLIVSQTQNQARLHLANIKKELETNELLKKDIGPFQEVNDEWGSTSIVLSNFNARITIASTEQSIRGIRHGQYRPDLVVCDDVEDLNSIKTRDSRDKTFQWFTGEILPIGDTNTKFIVVGNLLHEDCLLMRLKAMIENTTLSGKFFNYPLLDSNRNISWKDKFPDMDAIDKLKMSVGSESSWYREYLLIILPPEDQIIKKEWVRYYDVFPAHLEANCVGYIISIDSAISEKEKADKTAILVGRIYKTKDLLSLYILPKIFNKRVDYPDVKVILKELSNTVNSKRKSTILVEQVASQTFMLQDLQKVGYPAIGVELHGQDKSTRLRIASDFVKNGNVYFPKNGSGELIDQLLNFGVERYDDLVDAFSMLVNYVFVSPPKGLTSRCPIAVRVNFSNRGNNGIRGEDWADREDHEMLHQINPRGNWVNLIR